MKKKVVSGDLYWYRNQYKIMAPNEQHPTTFWEFAVPEDRTPEAVIELFLTAYGADCVACRPYQYRKIDTPEWHEWHTEYSRSRQPLM